ncbi:MAG: MFS transporter [Alphaproteobacteria bacterium]
MSPFPLKASTIHTTYIVFSGFCALLVAMGLARFIFATLIPLIIEAGWFSERATFLLAIANLIGYLAGTIIVSLPKLRLAPGLAIRASLLMAALSFFLCARPAPFAWFAFFLFCAGASAGIVLVLSILNVQSRTPCAHHALIGGILVAGMGSGLILSGLLVPYLATFSLSAVWLGLGAISLAIALITWPAWKEKNNAKVNSAKVNSDEITNQINDETEENASLPSALHPATHPATHRVILGIYASYSLSSLSLAMPQLLFVDFVVRDLQLEMSIAGLYLQLIGIGAILGPLFIGRLADRFGRGRAYRFTLLALGITLLVPVLSVSHWALASVALALGIFNFGQVGVLSARIRALLNQNAAASRHVWARASFLFGLSTAIGASLFTWLLVATSSYLPLFVISAALALFASLVEFAVARHYRSELPVCP